MTILHVDSSISGENSVSRVISQSIVDRLKTLNPRADVVRRDLGADPLPHFTFPASADNPALDEFLAADTVVVGAPMYNFAVPSQLKAWMDRLAVAGKTFRYGETGPEGLAGGRKLIIASTRGGVFSGESPAAFLDHQESYLRAFFAFLGVTDISFIRAEGVAISPEARARAVAAAMDAVSRLAA